MTDRVLAQEAPPGWMPPIWRFICAVYPDTPNLMDMSFNEGHVLETAAARLTELRHELERAREDVRLRAEVAAELRALLPQMREDADCHRTWTTDAARQDLANGTREYLQRSVGDGEWHQRWADFYDCVADTMERAAATLDAARAEGEKT